jgi:hypothetical protein
MSDSEAEETFRQLRRAASACATSESLVYVATTRVKAADLTGSGTLLLVEDEADESLILLPKPFTLKKLAGTVKAAAA